MCKGYKDSYGLEYLIIRPSTVYGGGFHDITSRLMTEWIIAGLKNKEIPIYGKEGKTLDFTYVSDFCDGVMLTIPEINKEYNISGGKERRLIDLADLIVKETGGGYIRWHDVEKAQPQKVNVDISEIKKLGYKPKISLEEGVRRTVNWYKDNPEVWSDEC
jgi:nucleoside-diphosphate-sugar epimerase